MPLPIEENELGTFIMSSKDMCTVSILPELIAAGIDSFKIEGRMKSAYYTALVTNAYRIAIDSFASDPENYRFDPALIRELESVSHREYCTGYYLDLPMDEANLTTGTGYIREKAYFAASPIDEADFLSPIPEGLTAENGSGRLYPFIQRNKVSVGDSAEIISPGRTGMAFTVTELYNDRGEAVESAPHPGMRFYVRVPFAVSPDDILRSGE